MKPDRSVNQPCIQWKISEGNEARGRSYVVCGGSKSEAAEEAEKAVEEGEGHADEHRRRCIHTQFDHDQVVV